MKMSTRGRKLLVEREGKRLKAYRDSVGIWTIGVGHTAAAGYPAPYQGMTISEQECEEILSRDLVKYEQAVFQALRVPVSQNEFDAMVSVCFNVGPKFATSTCIKKLNADDRAGAAEAIMLWSRPPEIIGRRRSEQKQFLTPYPGMIPEKKPSKATAPVVIGGAAGGAGAAAHQAGLPVWAVLAVVAFVGLSAFLIWKFKK